MVVPNVIVVGAGLSGLTTAEVLVENGVSVVVLEALRRVGGRTFTERNPKVNYVDLGAAYVGPTQNHVLQMAKDLGIETYKVNEVEDLLHFKDGYRTRFSSGDEPKRSNPVVDTDINNMLCLIDALGEKIPSEAPWTAENANEWDAITFQDFLRKRSSTKEAVEFFMNFINVNMAADAYETSLLSLLWYIKQCGGTRRINSSKNGAQEMKFKGGSQQISERLADKLGDTVVIKGNPVVGINQESEEFVLVQTLNGVSYKTKYVVLACPPILQMKIHFRPSLPPLRNQMMQRMPMGTVIKVILYYNTTFWREKGLCGTMMIEGGDNHPVYAVMDDTKPDGSYPALIGFISADKARRMVHLTPDERKRLFARSVAEVTECQEALKPIHYEEKNWMEAEYSGGCYTTTYPPGFFTRYGKVLRTPIDRLHFAGTETATKWSGYMDGAIAAGKRAALEVLQRIGNVSQSNIEFPQLEEMESEQIEQNCLPGRFGDINELSSGSSFKRNWKPMTFLMLHAIVFSIHCFIL